MLIDIPENVGYAALAGFVAVEASGVPVPGETALIASAVLASQGHLSIELVIAIAAVAAIVGDNVGYTLGARFGRRLLERPGRTQARRLEALQRGERPMPTRGAPLTDLKTVELELAGIFPDLESSAEGPSAAPESLRGAQLASERGWTAPAMPDSPPAFPALPEKN
jgi:hypothetical protein